MDNERTEANASFICRCAPTTGAGRYHRTKIFAAFS